MIPYNWKIRAGATFAYNLNAAAIGSVTLASSADDVKPPNGAYVARWGDDATGNGSRARPYKTVARGATAGLIVVIEANYIVREGELTQSQRVYAFDGPGGGFDGTGISRLLASSHTSIYNATIRNFANALGHNGCIIAENCVFENCGTVTANTAVTWFWRFWNCVFKDITGLLLLQSNVVGDLRNLTFVNCRNVHIMNNAESPIKHYSHIFKRSNVTFNGFSNIAYSHFYNCNVRNSSAQGTPATLPDFGVTVPTGFIYAGTTAALKEWYTGIYNRTDVFLSCRVADPLLNDDAYGDYSFALNSPARNASYEGKYIGARGPAQSTKGIQPELTNIQFTEGAYSLIDKAAEGRVLYPMQDLGTEQELGALNVAGLSADRNGEYFQAVPELHPVGNSAGEALATGSYYVVEGGTINYNGTMYNINARFQAVAAAASFTSTEGGNVRRIVFTPGRQTALLKTHRSIGTAEMFASLPFHIYEIGEKITANRQGDLGTGAIVRGNGDEDFDRTPSKVLPVFARYYQLCIVLQPNGLRG